MTKDQWIIRCAKHLVDCGQTDPKLAIYLAESQLKNLGGDLNENPEDAARDEMSYWED